MVKRTDPPRSVAEVDGFVDLLAAACSDDRVNSTLEQVLSMPDEKRRGFGQSEVEQLGQLIADVLDAPHDEKVVSRVRAEVTALCGKFPVYEKQG